MSGALRTDEQIRAAGAKAVAGWELTDQQVEQVAALLHPVRDEVWRPLDKPTTTADAA